MEAKKHLNFVDGLRGIAILAVLASHSYYFLLGPNFGNFAFKLFGGLLDIGQRGVQLFFMISAFTLFNSSFLRFKVDKYPILYFYIRRFFRIIPFYWIICLFWVLIYNPSIQSTLTSLFFYFGFNPNYGIVPGSWTLFVEETFYIFLPFLFLYINNFKRALNFTLILFLLSIYSPIYNYFFKNLNSDSIFRLPFVQWWTFGIGIIIYYIYQNTTPKYKLNSPILIWILGIFSLIGIKFGFTFQVLSLAILFLCAFYPENIIGKISRNRLLGLFGKYCYSIYLTHFLTLQGLKYLKFDQFINDNLAVLPAEIRITIIFLLLAALSFFISSLTFKYIETPFINLGKKLIGFVDQKKYFLIGGP